MDRKIHLVAYTICPHHGIYRCCHACCSNPSVIPPKEYSMWPPKSPPESLSWNSVPSTDDDTAANPPIRIPSVVIEITLSRIVGPLKSISSLSPTGTSFLKNITSIKMNGVLVKIRRSTMARLPSKVSLHYDPRGSRGSRAARLKVRSGRVEDAVWLVLFAAWSKLCSRNTLAYLGSLRNLGTESCRNSSVVFFAAFQR